MYLKIVLEDGFAIKKGTGIGNYTLNLFHQLSKSPKIKNVEMIEKTFLSKVSRDALRRVFYIVWLNSEMHLFLKRRGVDIIHFTNYLIPILRLSNVKYVVTIHDLTPWRFPKTLPSAYLPYIKWAISHAVRSADLILTVSNAVKKEIIELFGVIEGKVKAVYCGVSKEFLKTKKVYDKTTIKKFGITKDYLLFVGTIEERKNVITLLKAFKKLKNYKDLQLVLVGKPGYGFSKVDKYLENNHFRDDVILTGYVTEKDLIALYDLASIFIYPSLYEGFGIPLVEAMARGVPIVASKIPSTEEVASQAAIYYNDPLDYKALAKKVLELLENDALQQDLAGKGLKRVQEFSWKKVCHRHLQAYQELLRMDK